MRYVLALLLLTASPALATVLVPVSFDEMVTESRAIVYGRVAEVRSETTADRRSIMTLVTVDVASHLKGDFGPTVTFRVPGGRVGMYRRIVIGAPEFREGEDVVVFLSARGPSIPYLFGLSQGVYRVTRQSGGGALVSPPPVRATAGAERIVRGDPARRPLPLDAFAREVRAVLERAQ